MILNQGNRLNKTPSHKSNHADTRKKNPLDVHNANYTSQNEGGTNNRKRTLVIGYSIVKNIEIWRLDRRMKFIVAVKSIPAAIAKGMKYHVRGYLEDSSPNTASLNFGTNNLKTMNAQIILKLIK